MKAHLCFADPRNYPVTLTLTMTMGELVNLRDQMKDAPFYGPAQTLRGYIDEVTSTLNRVVIKADPVPDDG